MTPLERALRDRIRAEGPITVEAFMQACNDYYYATRDPLGARGDFITAPEISQMFGELIGACLADCWARAGKPEGAAYVELGPGRGTLAADALRTMRLAGLDPAVHFVETSPVLRKAQADAVPGAQWHDSVDALPDSPLLLLANEFLDALPVRQFANGIERKVIVAGGGLAFDRDFNIVEDSPSRDEAVALLARRISDTGGAAIVIDYGHARSAAGETLQAVRGHAFAPVLDKPGEQDLTAHVDFEAVSRAASAAGAAVTPVTTQGAWLQRLGIDARARSLTAASPERADEIAAARDRLCDPAAMGELFKVIAIHAPDWPAPAGFE
ncbi:class I SAM-dependent methyltransferase [Sphingomonas sabuli]|uniref:class I SAM-dependent methyltransferase n=1 Tax=Sphingomonas sabuli TaxID=2764186 RepID=UPI001FE5DD62|nr:SAM-dependent methyltransferase [Sphingomonas sabuli]